ncbi:hypothetical protein B0H14DRAFT_3763027 [Mycena olivaceomarginata]|nr:hypothetical protein B0H14DRAFT_3763027 [Mycena olivaceomarginata]
MPLSGVERSSSIFWNDTWGSSGAATEKLGRIWVLRFDMLGKTDSLLGPEIRLLPAITPYLHELGAIGLLPLLAARKSSKNKNGNCMVEVGVKRLGVKSGVDNRSCLAGSAVPNLQSQAKTTEITAVGMKFCLQLYPPEFITITITIIIVIVIIINRVDILKRCLKFGTNGSENPAIPRPSIVGNWSRKPEWWGLQLLTAAGASAGLRLRLFFKLAGFTTKNREDLPTFERYPHHTTPQLFIGC